MPEQPATTINNWHVITGPPSSGTSTTADILRVRGYNAIEEAARLYIDEGRARGLTTDELRKDEPLFQANVASLKNIIEKTQQPKETTFFVRGMPDTTAYMRLGRLEVPGWMDNLIQKSNYKSVYLLDALPDYDAQDYARVESQETAQRIGELLMDAYQECGLEPVSVPVMQPEERADFILSHLAGLQP